MRSIMYERTKEGVWGLMSKSFYIAGICAMVLIFNGCGYGGSGVAGTEAADTNPADTKQAVSEEAALGETGIVSDSADETREEALREEALRQVEAMDFTIQESPVYPLFFIY